MEMYQQKGKNASASALFFMAGFLLAFYLIIWLGYTLFKNTVDAAMAMLGGEETKLKTVILCAPVATLLFGMVLSAVSISSYTAMGSRKLSISKNISFSLVCYIFTGYAVPSTGLYIWIDEKSLHSWLEAVGMMNFNVWYCLLEPVVCYFFGMFMSVLANRIIQAQKS